MNLNIFQIIFEGFSLRNGDQVIFGIEDIERVQKGIVYLVDEDSFILKNINQMHHERIVLAKDMSFFANTDQNEKITFGLEHIKSSTEDELILTDKSKIIKNSVWCRFEFQSYLPDTEPHIEVSLVNKFIIPTTFLKQ